MTSSFQAISCGVGRPDEHGDILRGATMACPVTKTDVHKFSSSRYRMKRYELVIANRKVAMCDLRSKIQNQGVVNRYNL